MRFTCSMITGNNRGPVSHVGLLCPSIFFLLHHVKKACVSSACLLDMANAAHPQCPKHGWAATADSATDQEATGRKTLDLDGMGETEKVMRIVAPLDRSQTWQILAVIGTSPVRQLQIWIVNV